MKYCRLCLQPDTRPGIRFDAEGTCPACIYAASLADADWDARQKELQEIVAFGRSHNHSGYDCIIGVSGGKDSTRQALYVREVLKMNPLLVCLGYPPEQVTQRGVENVSNLIKLGFDCVSINPGPQTWRKLMRRSFLEHSNWCKSTELALFSSVPRLAIAYQIPLIWWGENAALQLGDLNVAGRAGWDGNNLRRMNTLSGGDFAWLISEEVARNQVLQYAYPSVKEMEDANLQIVFLGYFWRTWSLLDNGVYAVLRGLDIRREPPEDIGDPVGVTSLDEDWVTLNQMIKYYKFGFGRVTEYVNEDIRTGRISREDAIALVEKYDGKCSPRYIHSFCEYLEISEDKFWEVVDRSVISQLLRGPAGLGAEVLCRMSSRLKVVVVDYGVGNTHSVANAVAFLGYAPSVTADPAALARADVLVLPGVGAFEPAMQTLRTRGLVDLLAELVIVKRKPILGICLGMQLMAEDSEENGHHVGLGWIPGHVRRLRVPSEYSVPHVGWNDVQLLQRAPLFNRTGDTPNFYFDHSYHFVCEPAFQAAVCDYAGPVTAAVQRDNVFGVQFHPEKSQASGLKLLRGFFVAVGG